MLSDVTRHNATIIFVPKEDKTKILISRGMYGYTSNVKPADDVATMIYISICLRDVSFYLSAKLFTLYAMMPI